MEYIDFRGKNLPLAKGGDLEGVGRPEHCLWFKCLQRTFQVVCKAILRTLTATALEV